ncbi:glutamate racemase [Mongoliimonas terrestris]|uniref:glutamate racemase n=1 Tax=Mongoliimonas terrestris TaxID=1709001 RepID=UPI000949965B|nr:glutamate racemase [Mongoliimonas terrestris]
MRLVVFDSGVGGLSVVREIAASLPAADILYLADTAVFPYGDLEPDALVDRVESLMDRVLPAADPAAVVIACNTASTLVLPPLRARFAVPFVGTVPAVKPAAQSSRSRLVSVLATPGTVRRDYTRDLIREHGQDCRFTLVGSAHLATLVERHLAGDPVDDAAFAAEIAPSFVTDGDARTDTVVLACTHFPLVLDRLAAVAPWPVDWIDPAPAIARRVVTVAGGEGGGTGRRRILVTGRAPAPAFLAAFGFPSAEPFAG